MIYLYDRAICQDLLQSFNPDNLSNPIVRVIEPEDIIDLAAQIQNDEISFPIVALSRQPNVGVDKSRTNFTRLHRGVQTVLDPETNELYYEKVIPISLVYNLTILTTNIPDMDELVREILFKYTQMYFLTLSLPYECKRKVRFGVVIDGDSDIERKSGTSEYLKGGQLHQSIITLRCEGCVLVSYTPAKLRRTEHQIDISMNQ